MWTWLYFQAFLWNALTWRRSQTIQAPESKIRWWDLKRATRRATHLRRDIRKGHQDCQVQKTAAKISDLQAIKASGLALQQTPCLTGETECFGCFRKELQTDKGKSSVLESEERGMWGQLGRQRALGVSCSDPSLHCPPPPLLPDTYLESKYVSAPQM